MQEEVTRGAVTLIVDGAKLSELYSIMTTKLGETGKGENEHE